MKTQEVTSEMQITHTNTPRGISSLPLMKGRIKVWCLCFILCSFPSLKCIWLLLHISMKNHEDKPCFHCICKRELDLNYI